MQQQGDVRFTNLNTDTSVKCPRCESEHIETRNYAKKTGSAIGAVAGGTVGVAGALGGAEAGATVGLVAGPVGVAIGGIFGAIIGGLIGAVTGGAVGAQCGAIIDENALENYHCIECDYTFGK